jgi:hypothetical protein
MTYKKEIKHAKLKRDVMLHDRTKLSKGTVVKIESDNGSYIDAHVEDKRVIISHGAVDLGI